MTQEAAGTAEVQGLWTEVFGEPPAVALERGLMLQILVRNLPMPTYDIIRRNGVTPPFPPAT